MMSPKPKAPAADRYPCTKRRWWRWRRTRHQWTATEAEEHFTSRDVPYYWLTLTCARCGIPETMVVYGLAEALAYPLEVVPAAAVIMGGTGPAAHRSITIPAYEKNLNIDVDDRPDDGTQNAFQHDPYRPEVDEYIHVPGEGQVFRPAKTPRRALRRRVWFWWCRARRRAARVTAATGRFVGGVLWEACVIVGLPVTVPLWLCWKLKPSRAAVKKVATAACVAVVLVGPLVAAVLLGQYDCANATAIGTVQRVTRHQNGELLVVLTTGKQFVVAAPDVGQPVPAVGDRGRICGRGHWHAGAFPPSDPPVPEDF